MPVVIERGKMAEYTGRSTFQEAAKFREQPMKYAQPVLWAALSLAVGMIAGLLQNDSVKGWYPHLDTSALTPSDGVFPVAWTILYVLMAISIGLVRRGEHPGRGMLTGIFFVQLAVNFSWSVAFFTFRSPAAGLGLISILFPLLLFYAWKSWPINRVSAWLFVPYIFWVGFAWYLNWYIFQHN